MHGWELGWNTDCVSQCYWLYCILVDVRISACEHVYIEEVLVRVDKWEHALALGAWSGANLTYAWNTSKVQRSSKLQRVKSSFETL